MTSGTDTHILSGINMPEFLRKESVMQTHCPTHWLNKHRLVQGTTPQRRLFPAEHHIYVIKQWRGINV
jgi:hypothetical protein